MKKRYSDEQIVGFLREAESDVSVKELCRRYGVSEAGFYARRSKFAGLEVSNVKRLKALESENARLKKLLAEATLEQEVTREVLRKSGERGLASARGSVDDNGQLIGAPCTADRADERERTALSAGARTERSGARRDPKPGASPPWLWRPDDLPEVASIRVGCKPQTRRTALHRNRSTGAKTAAQEDPGIRTSTASPTGAAQHGVVDGLCIRPNG